MAEDLSEDAQDYIRSLSGSQRERNEAEGWAEMDTDEFKARVGPFVDSVEPKLDKILGTQEKILEGQKFSPMRMARNAVAGIAVIGLVFWEAYRRII